MKKYINLGLIILTANFYFAACESLEEKKTQEPKPIQLELSLDYGDYAIGMFDTLIFKDNEEYSYGSYVGSKPFLVKVWYPALPQSENKTMLYSEFLNELSDSTLKQFNDSLNSSYLNGIMEYGILINLGGDPNSIATVRDDSVLTDLLASKTKTIYNAPVVSGKFPTILYHHGYGSWAHDNYMLAEYLASHGFVVVSSNFEWVDYYNDFDQDNENILFMLDFMRKINFVDTSSLYAIGHSWGAQAFLYFDHLDYKPFKKIFSLHTTLENNDTLNIPKYWPELFDVLYVPSSKTTQTYIFAPEFPSNNFWAFRANSEANYTFINAKNPIRHDGFISLANFRHFFAPKYHFSDDTLLAKQFDTYQEINRYILENLSSDTISTTSFQRIYELI